MSKDRMSDEATGPSAEPTAPGSTESGPAFVVVNPDVKFDRDQARLVLNMLLAHRARKLKEAAEAKAAEPAGPVQDGNDE